MFLYSEMYLLQSMPFAELCANQDIDFVKYLYSVRIKKYPFGGDISVGKYCLPMRKNLDVLTGDAERYFYNCDFHMAYNVAFS